jgi:hypothetical protein
MRNRVEVRLEIRIDNPVTFEVQPLVDLSQRLMSVLPRPEAIREVFENRLEQRLDGDLHCCLNHTIGNDRDAQRPLRSVCLRDIHPPDRQRLVPLRNELCTEFAQESSNPNFLLNHLKGLLVDARSTFIGPDLRVCRTQHVFPAYLVVQHSELTPRIRLGC